MKSAVDGPDLDCNKRYLKCGKPKCMPEPPPEQSAQIDSQSALPDNTISHNDTRMLRTDALPLYLKGIKSST